MKKIRYRGWTGDKWVYGLPSYRNQDAAKAQVPDAIQCEKTLELVAITTGSIGKFIDAYDMQGSPLFEGDNVRSYRPVYSSDYETLLGYSTDHYGTVELLLNRFWLNNEDFGYEREDLRNPSDFIIVGNTIEGDGDKYNGDGTWLDDGVYVDAFYVELSAEEYEAINNAQGS